MMKEISLKNEKKYNCVTIETIDTPQVKKRAGTTGDR